MATSKALQGPFRPLTLLLAVTAFQRLSLAVEKFPSRTFGVIGSSGVVL